MKRPRKPRILHLGLYYPPDHGGIESAMGAIAEGLADEFDMWAVAHARTARSGVVRQRGVSVVRLPTLARFANTPLHHALPNVMRRLAPDVIHLHHPFPTAAIAVLMRESPAQLAVSWHAEISRYPILARLFDRVMAPVLRRADRVFVSDRKVIEQSRLLPEVEAKCAVIPYSVEATDESDRDRMLEAVLRARYGPRIVLAIGRLVPYKGFDVLVRAMVDVDGTCLIIGHGPLSTALTSQIAALGLADRVHLLGPVESTDPYLRVASVLAFPSVTTAESFGIVQIEAMMRECPVVNTSIDSASRNVSRDGVTGVTVPPGNARALALALTAILDDGLLRAKFSAAALQRVTDEYSRTGMLSRYRAAYHAMLGSSPKRD